MKIRQGIKWLKDLYPFLSKEEFFKILFSFILLGSVGTWLNHKFQEGSWERNVKYELFKIDLDADKDTVSGLAGLIDKRLFAAQQVVWVIDGGRTSAIESTWQTYMETVVDWNENVSLYQTEVAKLSDDVLAGELLREEDDLNNEIPKSIHYKFYRIHQNLLLLKECFYSNCDKSSRLTETSLLLEALNDQKFKYIATVNQIMANKAAGLKSSPADFLDQYGKRKINN